jgi:hypothetical protein
MMFTSIYYLLLTFIKGVRLSEAVCVASNAFALLLSGSCIGLRGKF